MLGSLLTRHRAWRPGRPCPRVMSALRGRQESHGETVILVRPSHRNPEREDTSSRSGTCGLGTAVTGSDTSANALFATLQQTAAHGPRPAHDRHAPHARRRVRLHRTGATGSSSQAFLRSSRIRLRRRRVSGDATHCPSVAFRGSAEPPREGAAVMRATASSTVAVIGRAWSSSVTTSTRCTDGDGAASTTCIPARAR